MKKIADRRETVVLVPVVLDPVQVQVALVVPVVEVRHVPVAVRVLPDGATICATKLPHHHPLSTLGIVSHSEFKFPILLHQVSSFLKDIATRHLRIRPSKAVAVDCNV